MPSVLKQQQQQKVPKPTKFKKLPQPTQTSTTPTSKATATPSFSAKLINHSSFPLAKRHVSLPTRGPKFTPTTTPKHSFQTDIKDFTRKVKIREIFWGQENDDESLHRNKSNRPIFTKNSEINQICNFMELLQLDKIFSKDNLSEVERTALSELQTNNDIIIKRADKGGNFVIMDKGFYRDKLVLEGHLNTNDHKRVNNDEDIKVMRDLKSITKKFEKELTTKEQQFICDFPWQTSNFYILPKIHKSTEIIQAIARSDKGYIEMSPPDNLKGRLIVAGPASPTQRLSEFLDTLLKPIVLHFPPTSKMTGIS